jgi:hypothetical protein
MAEEGQSCTAPRAGGFRADDLHSGLSGLSEEGPMTDVRHGSQTARPVREACDGEAEEEQWMRPWRRGLW